MNSNFGFGESMPAPSTVGKKAGSYAVAWTIENGGFVRWLDTNPQNYPITAADLCQILPEVLAPFIARIEALEARLAQLEGEGSLGLGGK